MLVQEARPQMSWTTMGPQSEAYRLSIGKLQYLQRPTESFPGTGCSGNGTGPAVIRMEKSSEGNLTTSDALEVYS